MISDTLGALSFTKQDKAFVHWTKRKYDELIISTQDRIEDAKLLKDKEVSDHLKLLNKRKMVDAGWNPFPKETISEGQDHVTHLLEKYVQDLTLRKRAGD